MAWPRNDMADDVDVVTAAHINAIVTSVKQWQGNVDANNYSIDNLQSISADYEGLPTTLNATGTVATLAFRDGNFDALVVRAVRSVAGTGWANTQLRLHRYVDGSNMTGFIWDSTDLIIRAEHFGTVNDSIRVYGTTGGASIKAAGIGSATGAPLSPLTVGGASSEYTDAPVGAGSGGLAQLSTGFALGDSKLLMGVSNTTGAWLLALKPGVTTLPVRIIGSAVVSSVLTAPASDSYLVNNSMFAWVDEAANMLRFRVKYSTGTVKTGGIALA